VEGLAPRVRHGARAVVVFAIQRGDAEAFSPNVQANPEFARALRKARHAGTRVLAYRCPATMEEDLRADLGLLRL
jgi:DNA-binding sugar fermentation-stimulating protein